MPANNVQIKFETTVLLLLLCFYFSPVFFVLALILFSSLSSVHAIIAHVQIRFHAKKIPIFALFVSRTIKQAIKRAYCQKGE